MLGAKAAAGLLGGAHRSVVNWPASEPSTYNGDELLAITARCRGAKSSNAASDEAGTIDYLQQMTTK